MRDVVELLVGVRRRLRSAWDASVLVQERAALLDRPWEEELLHWSFDGREWQLHGHLAPPPDGRRRSTTRDGWCPGLRTSAAPGT